MPNSNRSCNIELAFCSPPGVSSALLAAPAAWAAANGPYLVEPYGEAAGPRHLRYAVTSVDVNWFDPERDRTVPVRIYYPDGEDRKFPVIVFSTGLGRSRDDCAYLGLHWAGCGYVVVSVQHPGSDEQARQRTLRPKKELQKAFYEPSNVKNRPLDLIFRHRPTRAAAAARGERRPSGAISVASARRDTTSGPRPLWPWPARSCPETFFWPTPASRPSWP